MKILFKQAFVIIIFIILFLGIGEFLRYILVDDTNSFTRIQFHELYTSKKNIDVAFVGSSHCKSSFVPSIIDDKLDLYTFNIGSSSQYLDGSYVMIQELCSFNKPKHIYLELYYGVAGGAEYKNRKQMTATYIISDYMKPSFRKFIYLLNASSMDYYVDGFVLSRRYWKKIFDFNYIFNLIKKKQNELYKKYQWKYIDTSEQNYIERGFIAYNIKGINNICWIKPRYDEPLKKAIKLTEKNDWYKSLLQIINYCKNKNIKLTFVIAPELEITIIKQKNYQEYHDFIKNIADKHNLDFLDFNFCNKKYFDTNNLNLFYDSQHLNIQGAEDFSNIFADFVIGKISKEELFYNTLKEKLNSEKPNILSLAGPYENFKSKICEGYIVSNRDDKDIEYKIEMKPENGNNKIIQDYSTNNKFVFPVDEHGKLTVYWRLVNDKDKINVIVSDY